MDYCGIYRPCPGEDSETRTVRLKFLRSELLYDIKNNAYVESDVMSDDSQHNKHMTADIGEGGNVDRVSRVLSVVHTSVIELLYPYTKEEPVEEELCDYLEEPEAYIVEMSVPVSMSRTTISHLSKLIHEYMVYCVLADWLGITNPEASAKWSAKADAVRREIDEVKNLRRKAFTRKTHPW